MNRIVNYIFNLHFRYASIRKFIWTGIGFFSLMILIIISMNFQDVETSPVGWEKSFVLSSAGAYSKNVRVASKGDFVAVVYEVSSGESKIIYVSISFDGGYSFIKPIKAAETGSNIDCNPNVAISGSGHVAVVWQNMPPSQSSSKLYYTISKDMGATWSAVRPVFIKENVSDMELMPQFFYDTRGVLHVFYHSFREGALNLFHSTSSDEMLFSETESIVDLYGGLRGAFMPSIYFSDNNIYIAWQGKGERLGVLSDDIFFIKSSNYGSSWSSSNKITRSMANDVSPSIIMYRGVLYLVYQNNEKKNWAILMLRGYKNGDQWEEFPVKISETDANCYSPEIVGTGNKEAVIFWYDTREKQTGIYARKFSITQRKPLNEMRLSPSNVSARKPVSVSLGGKRVLVLWEQSGTILAKYTDVYVKPPLVSSLTHPSDKWSRSATILLDWKQPGDESGISGFASMLNNLPYSDPTIKNLEANFDQVKITDLKDGVSYFHIRSIDGAGNYSRTVHYRIQVSRNPPPTPVIVSPTHPAGKPAKSNSPEFVWSVEEGERLKGFIYSLSKDPFAKPETFTTSLKADFKNLDEGRYFFKIRAVDKTNTFSRVATYEAVVGKADALDPSVYNRLAKDASEKIVVPPEETFMRRIPYVKLEPPFDMKSIYDKTHFDAILFTGNVDKKNIIGYSVKVDKKKNMDLDRVNLQNNIVRIRDLEDGEYYIGIRCRYYKIENGKKNFYWTRPVIKKFTVKLHEIESPILASTEVYKGRLEKNLLIISFSLVTAVIMVMSIGFSARLTFYTRLLRFRFINIIKSFF